MAEIREMRDAIEEYIRDLMLAESRLDDLKRIQRGHDPRTRLDAFPLAELFTEKRILASEETGYYTYTYRMHIGVSVLIADLTNPDPDNPRKADVRSYLDTGAFMVAIKDLVLKHPDLGGVQFVDPDGNVETAWWAEVEEDYAGVDNRQNSFTNFGQITFAVQTRQLRAA